jgi:hypothetical protein
VAVLAAVSVTSAAAVALPAGRGGQEARAGAKGGQTRSAQPTAAPGAQKPGQVDGTLTEPVDALMQRHSQRLVELAKERFDAQRAYFNQGRITIDRFIQASELLKQAELEQARTREERIAALKNHRDRVAAVVKIEEGNLAQGRSTIADVSEARLAEEWAIIELLKEHKAPEPKDVAALRKRVEALEKKFDTLLNRRDGSGFIQK